MSLKCNDNGRRCNDNDRIGLFGILKILIPYIFKGAPLMFVYLRSMNIVYALVWFSIIPANQIMFDTAVNAAAGRAGYMDVVLAVLTVFVILLFRHFLNGLNAFNYMMYYHKIMGYLHYNIHEKANNIDLIKYEDKSCLDDMNKAVKGTDTASLVVGIPFDILTFYLPQIVLFSVYFYKLKPVLLFSVIMIFIPILASQFIRTAIYTKLEDEAAPIRREYEHYEECICGRQYFKETRILGVYRFFMELYRSALQLLNKKQWQADRRMTFWDLAMKALTLAGYGGVLYLLFASLLNGDISVGAFTAVFMSLDSLVGIIKELLYGHIANLTQNIGAVKNFVRFIGMPEKERKADPDADGDIVVRNVSFTYPGMEKPALKNIDLKISKGETIAIVGENGAGKSTLARLITGLYLPSGGTVCIGGKDTKDIHAGSLYNGISAVFQNFQKYKLSLKDNVVISDPFRENSIESVSADKTHKCINTESTFFRETSGNGSVEAALEMAGLAADSNVFPKGGETMLSCEFNGIDLSGGQWQRVAIARGLFRAHNLIILDEPTAAIDPVEETEIFRRFAEISKGKMTIIITHRLGSAKIADRIIVLDKGGIAESGTHEELIASKGKYAVMFARQARWYN